jgi:hypothetical protein
MTDEAKLPAEIAHLIQEQAVASLGPWPRDLELFIFVSKVGWSCGLSPATQVSEIEYREGVLKIVREMKAKYPAGSVKGRRLDLAPEQHSPQGKDDRSDPDDHGGLPFRDGGRRFHNSINPKGS